MCIRDRPRIAAASARLATAREQVRLALRALYAGTIARAHDHGREAAGRVDWRRLAAQVNACATIDGW